MFYGLASLLINARGFKTGTAKTTILKKREGLLQQHELIVMQFLLKFLKTDLHICPQVHLAQIFDFNNEEVIRLARSVISSQRDAALIGLKESWINYGTGNKSVDFLICDRRTSAIVCAIEVDGSTHTDNDEKKRWDETKTMLFKSCSIPLLRLKNVDFSALSPENEADSEQAFALFQLSLKQWKTER